MTEFQFINKLRAFGIYQDLMRPRFFTTVSTPGCDNLTVAHYEGSDTAFVIGHTTEATTFENVLRLIEQIVDSGTVKLPMTERQFVDEIEKLGFRRHGHNSGTHASRHTYDFSYPSEPGDMLVCFTDTRVRFEGHWIPFEEGLALIKALVASGAVRFDDLKGPTRLDGVASALSADIERGRASNFICAECDKPALGGYMVLDAVWLAVMPSRKGFLHLKCLEKRLGRPVVADDFNRDIPINSEILWLLEGRQP